MPDKLKDRIRRAMVRHDFKPHGATKWKVYRKGDIVTGEPFSELGEPLDHPHLAYNAAAELNVKEVIGELLVELREHRDSGYGMTQWLLDHPDYMDGQRNALAFVIREWTREFNLPKESSDGPDTTRTGTPEVPGVASTNDGDASDASH